MDKKILELQGETLKEEAPIRKPTLGSVPPKGETSREVDINNSLILPQLNQAIK
jgi:hypothetical protein